MSRTTTACETCHRRKRKCNGRRPTCSSCELLQVECHYLQVQRTRRRKYWDQDYVRSLETQVELLSQQLARQNRPANEVEYEIMGEEAQKEDDEDVEDDNEDDDNREPTRSDKALADFVSLSWVDKPDGDQGSSIFSGPGYFNTPFGKAFPAFQDASSSPSSSSSSPPTTTTIQDFARNTELKAHLRALFLDEINIYYNFVEPAWLQFADAFPANDPPLQFLYSAVFAAAAHCSPRACNGEHECLVGMAEDMVLECCLRHLCLPVLQGLLILSCIKHSLLQGREAWLYHYMAIGLSSSLRINQAAQPPDPTLLGLDTAAADTARIRSFWALVFLDGHATPTLGSPPRIPWDAAHAPGYLTTLAPSAIDVPALAFDAHCRLSAIQQRHAERIYALGFEALGADAQDRLLAEGMAALAAFRREGVHEALVLTRTTRPHRTQLVFWMSYHTTIINLHRRFLKPPSRTTTTTTSTARQQQQRHASALRAMTAAATSTTHLLRLLEAQGELDTLPTFAIYDLIRTSLVHALNAAISTRGRRRTAAVSGLRTCAAALARLSGRHWRVAAGEACAFLDRIMREWDVRGVAVSSY